MLAELFYLQRTRVAVKLKGNRVTLTFNQRYPVFELSTDNTDQQIVCLLAAFCQVLRTCVKLSCYKS